VLKTQICVTRPQCVKNRIIQVTRRNYIFDQSVLNLFHILLIGRYQQNTYTYNSSNRSISHNRDWRTFSALGGLTPFTRQTDSTATVGRVGLQFQTATENHNVQCLFPRVLSGKQRTQQETEGRGVGVLDKEKNTLKNRDRSGISFLSLHTS
jgi:hypothetical protein